VFAAGVLLASAPAAADTLRYDGAWFGSYHSSYTLYDSTPPIAVNASSGAFRMTNVTAEPDNTFMAWCVDIYHRLNTGSGGSSYTFRTAEQFYGAGSSTIGRLERLASYVVDNDGNALTNTLQSALTGAFQSAAFQLAVWEIVNEATSTLNVNSPDFYVSGGSSNVRQLANTWLTNSQTWSRTQTFGIWEGPNTTQDLAVFAPIPEPETYAMIIAGLGLMAFVVRRRRTHTA
jgi:hypothetical protein